MPDGFCQFLIVHGGIGFCNLRSAVIVVIYFFYVRSGSSQFQQNIYGFLVFFGFYVSFLGTHLVTLDTGGISGGQLGSQAQAFIGSQAVVSRTFRAFEATLDLEINIVRNGGSFSGIGCKSQSLAIILLCILVILVLFCHRGKLAIYVKLTPGIDQGFLFQGLQVKSFGVGKFFSAILNISQRKQDGNGLLFPFRICIVLVAQHADEAQGIRAKQLIQGICILGKFGLGTEVGSRIAIL